MAISRRTLATIRDAAWIAILAVVTVQALRRWLGDRYLVPTGSMEPALHGDPRHGDVVFVDKLASASAQRRHDLVVVMNPADPGQQMVKRIAARGDDMRAGCWIDIRQGDVWLGADAQSLRRETKEPLDARGQRATWAMAPATGAALDGLDLGSADAADASRGPWSLRPVETSVAAARRLFATDVRVARRRSGARSLLPEGFVGSSRPVDAGFLDATGARSTVGNDVHVADVGIDLALVAVVGDVLATIETRHEALTFHWQPATGRVVLWRDGEDVAATTWPVGAPPGRLEFGLLDDRAFCCVDGDPGRSFIVPRRDEWNADAALAGPRTLAYVGMLGAQGTAALTFRSLQVFHDVFAWRDPIAGMPGQAGGWPRHVRPGYWFLLGDSTFDSHDSRQFDEVPCTLFLGVPRLVVGPWPRTRWVRP